MFDVILVAYDGSENSKRALDLGIDLAKKYSAKLYVIEAVDVTVFENVGILPPLSAVEDMEKKAKKDIDQAIQLASNNGVQAKGEVLEGEPSESILGYSKEVNASIIVIGSRGLSRFRKALLGSVSTRVLNESRVPVMIVK
ncbi:universal stress protein UspA [Candidatus Acidianus copahuensis]|uniref:Universal stress protein UspA n=1 Tax=Candidatus Acidianus copahuensis TaxID=1160895 RepID=A0A031LPR8_9CREN|nr:universal stress protein [Candidatus Acidianus copahuensis]EZQ06750.1 universal stress protein UspA [Candidatus Acidianus copahuensis]